MIVAPPKQQSLAEFRRTILARLCNVELRREDMHDYQRTAYEFARANPFSALFIDMGLGKTVSIGTLVCDLIMEFLSAKVLIIGPLKVATDTWPNEIRKWEQMAPVSFQVLREDPKDPRIKAAGERARAWCKSEGLGSADYTKVVQRAQTVEAQKIREELARSNASIHIVNRENVEWLVNLHAEKWPYRTVIIDESSSFKDHASGRFKALQKVRNTEGLIKRLHLLTATPATEGYIGLWSQMFLLDKGKALGKNISAYRRDYFEFNKYGHEYKLRSKEYGDAILEKIKHMVLVMKADEYLPMDKPTIQPHYVNLDADTMGIYNTMATEHVVQLKTGQVIEGETAAAVSAKLLQIASGVLYETTRLEDWDTGDMKKVKVVHDLHEEKLITLREMIEELDGEPVLVAYHFKSTLARLQKAFPKAVTMDPEGKCIDKWNKRKIPVLFVHPQSAGHGLNLQKGGHNIILYDIPWSLENYLQLIGRLARQGQKHPVLVRLLLAKGTIDEIVYKALNSKTASQDNLFNTLRRMIRKLRKAAGIVEDEAPEEAMAA